MNYKDSKIYQRAYKLAIDLHLLLKNRFQEIDFTLANHLRKESRELLGHLADGWTRFSPKAKRFGYFKAVNAIHQILMDLEFMRDLNHFPKEDYNHFFQEYEDCARHTYALMRSISAEKKESSQEVEQAVTA